MAFDPLPQISSFLTSNISDCCENLPYKLSLERQIFCDCCENFCLQIEFKPVKFELKLLWKFKLWIELERYPPPAPPCSENFYDYKLSLNIKYDPPPLLLKAYSTWFEFKH